MQQRSLMQFRLGQIKTLTFTPNAKKEPTASLKLSAELTPELADIIGCRDSIFRSDGKPHAKVTKHELGGMILRDIDLTLPTGAKDGTTDTYRPEDIASFGIEIDGMLVSLSMLARIKGRRLELVSFLEGWNTDKFEFAIRTAQKEFDWAGAGGTGESVDMGSGEVKGPLFDTPGSLPCLHCDTEVPKNEDGRHMVNGELVICPNEQKPVAEKHDGPALPAIHLASGRGPKRQRTRAEMTPPTPEEIENSVTVEA